MVLRQGSPRHKFVVLNRLNTSNHWENVSGDMDVQRSPNFVMYRSAESGLRGLWFHNAAEGEIFADMLQRFPPPPLSLCVLQLPGCSVPGVR